MSKNVTIRLSNDEVSYLDTISDEARSNAIEIMIDGFKELLIENNKK